MTHEEQKTSRIVKDWRTHYSSLDWQKTYNENLGDFHKELWENIRLLRSIWWPGNYPSDVAHLFGKTLALADFFGVRSGMIFVFPIALEDGIEEKSWNLVCDSYFPQNKNFYPGNKDLLGGTNVTP